MEVFQKKFDKYISDGNSAVHFKIVKGPKDLTSNSTNDEFSFSPLMCHQIFGEKEQIFGYVQPKLTVYYCTSTLDTYVEFSSKDEISSAENENIQADNVVEKVVSTTMTYKTQPDKNAFLDCIEKQQSFKPIGEKVHEYTSKSIIGTDRTFEIYKATTDTEGLAEYHEKMQSFILWFIDCASFIDAEDSKWEFFILYEKEELSDDCCRYNFVGYSTCYRFYAFPEHERPRVSQVLVLPPYQKMGHCVEILNTIFKDYRGVEKVIDITAEDPSEDFQRVRDYVDALNCLKLSSSKGLDFITINSKFDTQSIEKSFSKKKFISIVNRELKINKRQAARVYEVLVRYILIK